MTLTQLHIFLTVAETGNFTLAAERLYMTQSAVSHALASLERDLGVMLLQRGRTGVTMTSVGEQVLMCARIITDQVECIQQETAEARGIATGKLCIGSVPSVSKGVLPPLLGSFRRSYPGIAVTLLDGTDQEVYDWLVSRAVDISVVTLKPCHTAFGLRLIHLADQPGGWHVNVCIGTCLAELKVATRKISQKESFPQIGRNLALLRKTFLLEPGSQKKKRPQIPLTIVSRQFILIYIRFPSYKESFPKE